MSDRPRVEQLAVPPEYGMPTELLDWDVVVHRLTEARHYWLAVAKADGTAHVVALDGLWIDDRWYFGGRPTTAWQRHLRANPKATLHLEDAESAVIVEGTCRVEHPGEDGASRLVATSQQKYGFAPPRSAYLAGVWVLTPTVARAWTSLAVDATRFRFE